MIVPDEVQLIILVAILGLLVLNMWLIWRIYRIENWYNLPTFDRNKPQDDIIANYEWANPFNKKVYPAPELGQDLPDDDEWPSEEERIKYEYNLEREREMVNTKDEDE